MSFTFYLLTSFVFWFLLLVIILSFIWFLSFIWYVVFFHHFSFSIDFISSIEFIRSILQIFVDFVFCFAYFLFQSHILMLQKKNELADWENVHVQAYERSRPCTLYGVRERVQCAIGTASYCTHSTSLHTSHFHNCAS